MKAKMIDLFLWWMTERHDIYLRRKDGKPWPWTDDEIMRTYKFTNVYRELDRVTQELHRLVDPMGGQDPHDRLFHVILFRAFNWPPTYELLLDSGAVRRSGAFDATVARKELRRAAKTDKVFTGAYIITNAGSNRSKIDLMVDAMKVVHAARRTIWKTIAEFNTMEDATEVLTNYPSLGNFTAYEVACDLRYQKGMLDRATDVMTWANPGPGAKRGIRRLMGGGAMVEQKISVADCITWMQTLLLIANKRLPRRMPRLEMREIEHSLCEFDKYLRAKRGEGRPRSKYVHKEA